MTLMAVICRDCITFVEKFPDQKICKNCGSSRIFSHSELSTLNISHLDCDAFYASVEKRDDPSLRSKPVIVGGGRRGVVAACCYIARINGVHSAMPMFKALELCPDAVVIRPNLKKYGKVATEVRRLMRECTPLVEPLSIDEAFLDLSGTDKLHKGPPAKTLTYLTKRIEAEVGVTVSIGLSYNKFLAKVASNLDKPRGFAVIGKAEAERFLAEKPVRLLWGVGPKLEKQLEKNGITKIKDLRAFNEKDLVNRYGIIGRRLYRFSRGRDDRMMKPHRKAKSISAEVTFEQDISELENLKGELWQLSEKVAGRLKKTDITTSQVTLKMRKVNRNLVTKTLQLIGPTQLAEDIYQAAYSLLSDEASGDRFRLIGIMANNLIFGLAVNQLDFSDSDQKKQEKVESAMDLLRARYGAKAIWKGRGWTGR